MKIVVSEPIHDTAMEILRTVADVVVCKSPADMELGDADAVIVRAARLTRQQIENAPRLKVIGKHGVGVNAISVACARERGIPVVYTPSSNSNAVAEMAIGLMLAAARKLKSNDRMLMSGAGHLAPPSLNGLELTGKTLGLIGYGNIGSRVARIARYGFAMTVYVYAPSRSDEVLASAGLRRAESVAELCALSDFVSVHVPLTEKTRGMIGAAELAACRKNTIIINTARGGVVDEAALYAALAEGRIYAAASDVFTDEPAKPDNPLLSLDNFIGTLHVGANTEEALVRVGRDVAEDVIAVLQGRQPKHPYTGPAPADV